MSPNVETTKTRSYISRRTLPASTKERETHWAEALHKKERERLRSPSLVARVKGRSPVLAGRAYRCEKSPALVVWP
eukprot:1161003-Pelagomonas_calceolata.AAC.4